MSDVMGHFFCLVQVKKKTGGGYYSVMADLFLLLIGKDNIFLSRN